MDTALADRLAARHHLHSQGWIARRSEHFRHLPPPALEAWIGPSPTPGVRGACPVRRRLDAAARGPAATAGVDARWLDALDPAQRNALFADLPAPVMARPHPLPGRTARCAARACACASTHRPARPPPTATPSGCTCITNRATPWKRHSW
jgi:hypothetical protein